MKLNFTELRGKLERQEDVLVDGSFLEIDMRTMYEYYSETVDRPPQVERYFSNHDNFEFFEFTKCYVESVIGRSINLTYTDDGWLKLV